LYLSLRDGKEQGTSNSYIKYVQLMFRRCWKAEWTERERERMVFGYGEREGTGE